MHSPAHVRVVNGVNYNLVSFYDMFRYLEKRERCKPESEELAHRLQLQLIHIARYT